jgi:hypothetical protein
VFEAAEAFAVDGDTNPSFVSFPPGASVVADVHVDPSISCSHELAALSKTESGFEKLFFAQAFIFEYFRRYERHEDVGGTRSCTGSLIYFSQHRRWALSVQYESLTEYAHHS